MLKVLVVDDSKKRVDLISEAIEKSNVRAYVDLHICGTADTARSAMLQPFDVLILDILIPKKDRGVPQALHSVNLLSDITDSRKKYIRPKLIMGLTADISELKTYQQNFIKAASVVLDGSLSRLDWLDLIIEQLEILVQSAQKTSKLSSDKLLISIHGIRTYGQWQNFLKVEMEKYSRSFSFVEIKYGFFDLLSFIVPPLRRRKARLTANRLIDILKEHDDKEISIVAHSFGTLVLSEALKRREPGINIKTIILCGSPMEHNENIDHIVAKAELTINDCGVSDYILLLARSFILGLGDAGRIGFFRENSPRFLNRYHKGGHSLYFNTPEDEHSFAEKFWLPSLLSDVSVEAHDCRKNYFAEDIVDLTIKIASKIKPYIYVSAPIAALYVYFRLY